MIQQTTTCNNAAQLTDLCMQMENQLLSEYSFIPVYYKKTYLVYQK